MPEARGHAAEAVRPIGAPRPRRYSPAMGSFNVALLEALLSAGVSPERARAVVEQFERAVDDRYSLHAQVLATKRDVAELEVRLTREMAGLSREMAGLRTDLGREIAGVKADLSREIAAGKVEIAAGKVDLVKWALAALTAQTALLLGASRLL